MKKCIRTHKGEKSKDWLTDAAASEVDYPIPQWARKMKRDITLRTLPTMTARTQETICDPGEVGATIGHLWAMVRQTRIVPELADADSQRRIAETEAHIKKTLLIFLEGVPDEARKAFDRFCRAWKRGWIDKQKRPVGLRGYTESYEVLRWMSNHPTEIETMTFPGLCVKLQETLPADVLLPGNPAAFRERVKSIVKRYRVPLRRKTEAR